MPCPSSGQISIQDLVDEFGGSAPHALSEYYRNGALVPGNNTNIPESGEITLTDCYSAVNEIQHTHSDGDTHADYSSIFGDNWASTVPKRVIVPSGVTVGGTSTHAMLLPSGMGGTIVFDIDGNVHGKGGASGAVGGDAIHCVQTSGVTINVNSGASVKSGGGGGGQGGQGGTGGAGGQGGTGGQGHTWSYAGIQCESGCGESYTGYCFYCGGLGRCRFWHGSNVTYASTHGGCGYGNTESWQCWNCYTPSYHSGGAGGSGGSGGAGGAGGAGGVGQGYGQSATSGSSGSSGSSGNSGSGGSGGGTNAGTGGTGGTGGQGGTGGTGGTGGSFGNQGATGATGSTGSQGGGGGTGSNGNHTNGSGGNSGSGGSSGSSGSAGGLAGYYIYNRNNITLNNSGTVSGR